MKNIWTNGCFDIIHTGHIELFKYAKSLGDQLIVGIDSDSRIRDMKGSKRPINSELDRKIVLESIKYIDYVIIFRSSLELMNHIKNFNITNIVIGNDYIDKEVIGSEFANVIYFDRIGDKSTSKIIQKMNQ